MSAHSMNSSASRRNESSLLRRAVVQLSLKVWPTASYGNTRVQKAHWPKRPLSVEIETISGGPITFGLRIVGWSCGHSADRVFCKAVPEALDGR